MASAGQQHAAAIGLLTAAGHCARVPVVSDRVLTTAEAARVLGVPPRTFRRRVHAGEIPYVRKAPVMLFDAAVIEYLAAQNAITVRPYRRRPETAATS